MHVRRHAGSMMVEPSNLTADACRLSACQSPLNSCAKAPSGSDMTVVLMI